MNQNDHNHRAILRDIAHQAMLERGLLPDFSSEALAELKQLPVPVISEDKPIGAIRDMRKLLWASIDNDDSHDLDQLTAAEEAAGGKLTIYVAIADVDASIHKGSALDHHAYTNTTSVYTAGEIFPMLPEQVSTDLTSLNFNEDRLSIVIEMQIGADGSLVDSSIYQAWVHNYAQLAYNSVAAWLEKNGPIPEAVSAVKGLAENLLLQDQIAQKMKTFRHVHGALSLETIDAKPVFDGDQIRALEIDEKNRAKEIIEDFMIAANGVTARYLSAKKFPSIRRVVRTPRRWERIVDLAANLKYSLPKLPNSKALEEFLIRQKKLDPLHFPDLSLAVIKLLGAGEYIAEFPGTDPSGSQTSGHFGLAVKDYSHSTAPNRRYPDLLTQRMLKAALARQPVPYHKNELEALALHCTEAEDAANKVERQVGKSAAALLLEARIGEYFDAIVTGASEKGTWIRLLHIPVDGMLVHGFDGLDVGDPCRVQLQSVDVRQGFIDFVRTPRHKTP